MRNSLSNRTIIGLVMALSFTTSMAQAVDLTKATIVYQKSESPLVGHMAEVLADDIERVSGIRPEVSRVTGLSGQTYMSGNTKAAIVLSTADLSKSHKDIRGSWERYAIDTNDGCLYITGSDARGLAYGVFHVSEAIGVSPWYWFADVPVNPSNKRVFNYQENYVSKSPTVKYRGVFINDEDWGLKTWAAKNYERDLGDIGPKTYDKVCELILRLKGPSPL